MVERRLLKMARKPSAETLARRARFPIPYQDYRDRYDKRAAYIESGMWPERSKTRYESLDETVLIRLTPKPHSVTGKA